MKRILAIITSLALLLSVAIIPSAFVVNAEETTPPTYYVKADGGSDTNDGLSEETALATINAAQALIAAKDTDTTGQDGTIVVIGTAEFDGGVPHKGMITLKGTDDNTSKFKYVETTVIDEATGEETTVVGETVTYPNGNTGQAVVIKGPTTIDNIYLPRLKPDKDGKLDDTYPHTYGLETPLVSGGHELVISAWSDSVASGINRYFRIGHVDGTPEDTRQKVTFNKIGGGGSAAVAVTVGAVSATNTVSAGLDLAINGGTSSRINALQFAGGHTYTGNVNIVFDNLSKGSSSVSFSVGDNVEFNGAFQMIINNNRIGQFKSTAITNMNNVVAADGSWIMRCAKDTTRLATTEAAGKFELSDENMVAKAYAYNVETGETATEATAISKGGVLDLSATPGVYDVTFSTLEAKENTDTTVYVSEDGADEYEGTKKFPFATIDFAQKWLAKSTATGEKTIMVKGTVDFDGGEAHSEMITIKGYDKNAALNFIKSEVTTANSTAKKNILVLQGPTTFDNINLPEGSISDNCHELVFQNMPSEITSGKYDYYITNTKKADVEKRHKVVINDLMGQMGVTHQIHLTSLNSDKRNGGVDLEVNGGRILQLNFTKTEFLGDVNVVLNNFGTRKNGESVAVTQSSTFKGVFQFIANNGTYANFNDTAKERLSALTADGGKWVIDAEKVGDGTVLKLTETAGKFELSNKNMIATAYKVVDGVVATEATATSVDGTLDLSGTEKAGVYTVKYSLPEADKPFDVDGDRAINGADLVAVTKAILKGEMTYKINGDDVADIRDFVALKVKLAEIA